MTADEVSMTADGALMIDAEALMIGGGVHMCLLHHHHHHLHRILVMSHTAIIASRLTGAPVAKVDIQRVIFLAKSAMPAVQTATGVTRLALASVI